MQHLRNNIRSQGGSRGGADALEQHNRGWGSSPNEQRQPRYFPQRHTKTTAAIAGHQGADHVSGLPGSSEKHDLPVRTRHLPNVRRPDVGVSNMSQGGGQTYSAVLKIKDCHRPHCALKFSKGRLYDGRIVIRKESTTFRGRKCFPLAPCLFLTTALRQAEAEQRCF